jgi:flavin-dependent dehydrogenase
MGSVRILVTGAGPSGCAFAITAARRGHAVTLVDEGRRRPPWTGESLPAGGRELLESVFGAGVLDGQAVSHGTAAAWGSPELAAHDFMAHWSGMGWHVDRTVLDPRLHAACADAGVDMRVGGTVDRIDSEWVIDATGRAGAIAARRGAQQQRFDDQIALVATVPDLGGERVTTVESCKAGWWYSQPVGNGDRVIALITDADLVDVARRDGQAGPVGLDRADIWSRHLAGTEHIRRHVETLPAEVAAYPAGATMRDPIVGEDWLAVGDAAVSFDPMSSQGLITGVVMAAHAAIALDRGPQALEDWAADYRVVLDEHRQVRSAFWAQESRWPDAPFWSRRAG